MCPTLSAPSNGAVLNEGSMASYACDIGYQLNGKEVLVCGTNGVWSSPPPTCQSMLLHKIIYVIVALLKTKLLISAFKSTFNVDGINMLC